MIDIDKERYCLACDKAGHRTDECHSTVALNTPQARELYRLCCIAHEARAALPQPPGEQTDLPVGYFELPIRSGSMYREVDPKYKGDADVVPLYLRPAPIVAAQQSEATSGPTYEDVAAILNGIDRDECSDQDGWWETETGAEFGAARLAELKALFATPAAQEAPADPMAAVMQAAMDAPRNIAARADTSPKGNMPDFAPQGALAQPDAWRKLSEADRPDAARRLDVVLWNGCTREGQHYTQIDWSAVVDWRYSAAQPVSAAGGESERLAIRAAYTPPPGANLSKGNHVGKGLRLAEVIAAESLAAPSAAPQAAPKEGEAR